MYRDHLDYFEVTKVSLIEYNKQHGQIESSKPQVDAVLCKENHHHHHGG